MGTEQQTAFERLKEQLIKQLILQYSQFNQPFILYTDACKTGLGAVLAQIQKGKEVVISYASRTTNAAEEKYSITNLECLAVIWAIRYYHHYLYSPFTLVTDHAALKWLKTSRLPKGRRARWIMELQQHQFEIKHRPGKSNSNTDALSRMYEKEESIENEVQVHSLRNGNQYLWNLGPVPGESEEEMEIYFAETTSEIFETEQPRPFSCCEEMQCNYEQDVYKRFYQENQRQYHSDRWSDINKEEEYHGDWSNYGNHPENENFVPSEISYEEIQENLHYLRKIHSKRV